MYPPEPYNPLDKRNLGKSVGEALLTQEINPLPPTNSFEGAGVYVLYYTGNFEPYRPIMERNRDNAYSAPIYIGKAVPPGARKGLFGLDSAVGAVLYGRLVEHSKSIEQTTNLRLEDFACRFLIVDDIWIPLGESLLIAQFAPLWNRLIDGFGIHDPGKGRYNQQRSAWDVLHPGRQWATRCQPNPKSAKQLITTANEFLNQLYGSIT